MNNAKKTTLDKTPKLKRPLRYSIPALIGIAFLVVLLARATIGVYHKEAESHRNLAAVSAEFKMLQERHEVLKRETNKLNTQEGIEQEIRKKFQVAKPGESLLVVVDKPLPPSAEKDEAGFFSKMWSNVSGVFNNRTE